MIHHETSLSLVASSGGSIDKDGTVHSIDDQGMCLSSGVYSDHRDLGTDHATLRPSLYRRTLMNENQHRRRTDGWSIRPIKISFIIMIIVFFLILVGFGKVVADLQDNSHRIGVLVVENSNRIKEIQKSRLESCERTYNGIREVFLPFFPHPPRTHRQKADLKKFNTTINKLVKACVKQTKPKPIKKGVNPGHPS
jgi:hypothetical protein